MQTRTRLKTNSIQEEVGRPGCCSGGTDGVGGPPAKVRFDHHDCDHVDHDDHHDCDQNLDDHHDCDQNHDDHDDNNDRNNDGQDHDNDQNSLDGDGGRSSSP